MKCGQQCAFIHTDFWDAMEYLMFLQNCPLFLRLPALRVLVLANVLANMLAYVLAITLAQFCLTVWAFAADLPTQSLAVFPEKGKLQIQANAVLLNPANPNQTHVGEFVYKGGLLLSSEQTHQLHGFSDLDVIAGKHLIAVGDRGALLKAELVLDQQQVLTGLEAAELTPLMGEDGQLLLAKESSDAEGLAHLINGDRLISFEELHRVLHYPAGGGLPRPAPFPRFVFEPNQGMEALAADLQNPQSYWVGAEFTGDVWQCWLNKPTCYKSHTLSLPPDLYLVAMRQLPKNRTAYLLRGYFPERKSNQILLRIVDNKAPDQILAQLELVPPLIEDNFEGLAAVPLPSGGTRFYLISDDNFNPEQDTLLLAFDWQP